MSTSGSEEDDRMPPPEHNQHTETMVERVLMAALLRDQDRARRGPPIAIEIEYEGEGHMHCAVGDHVACVWSVVQNLVHRNDQPVLQAIEQWAIRDMTDSTLLAREHKGEVIIYQPDRVFRESFVLRASTRTRYRYNMSMKAPRRANRMRGTPPANWRVPRVHRHPSVYHVVTDSSAGSGSASE